MPSIDKMNSRTAKAFIHNITKNANTYTIELAFNSQTITYKFAKSQIGINLMDGITALGIGNGGSFLESLSPSPADFTYADDPDSGIIPRKVEILASTLTKFKSAKALENGRNITNTSEKKGKYTFIYDVMPQNLSDFKYMRGPIISVRDGDTFEMQVYEGEHAGTMKAVRLTGVNTVESPKDDPDFQADTERKNRGWLKSHGYEASEKNLELTYKYAAESKALIVDHFKAPNGKSSDPKYWVLVLIDDYYQEEDSAVLPGEDIYGRKLGNVFKPYDVPGSTFSAISLNKTLLASQSTSFPGEPLGYPYYMLGKNGQVKSKFAVTTWWQFMPSYKETANEIESAKQKNSESEKDKFLREHNLKLDKNGVLVYNGEDEKVIDIRTYVVKKNDTWASIAAQFKNGQEYTTEMAILRENGAGVSYAVPTSYFLGKTIKVPILQKFGNTYQDYLESRYITNLNSIPADSEDENYIEHPYDDRDELDGIKRTTPELVDKLERGGFLRIGDCSFVVPPISIRVDNISHAKQTPALRTKSTIQTNNGHTTRVITMKLYFANENQVNGYPVNMPKINEVYYRNGLRPLIAQFKKAPFLPIENELINGVYQIYAVAFKDIQINTVPGFPGCVEAYISLYEFDHTVYMPGDEYFSGAFNWKLFRWYYQRPLQEKNAKIGRTYLEPVNVKDDSIQFFLPDETILAQRQEAIANLNKKIDPGLFAKTNSDKDTESGKMMVDSDSIAQSKAEHSAFKKWLLKYPMSDYGKMYDAKGVFDPTELLAIKDATEKDRYKKAILDYLNSSYKFEEANTKVANAGARGGTTNVSLTKKMVFLPNKISIVVKFLNNNGYSFGIQDGKFVMTKVYHERSKQGREVIGSDNAEYDVYTTAGGAYFVELQASENKMIVKKKIKASYIIDPSDIVVVKQIENGGKEIRDSFIQYQADIEELNYIAHMTEADIPTVSFDIGQIFITNIAAQMSNTFGIQQLLGSEAPTLQFLGSQDTAINIQFVTKERAALRRFHKLMSETQRLSREYRIAITSGVLTIKNNMLSLLGAKDFVITALSVQTSETDKESFVINMQLTVFDKTQRVREDLDFTSISETIPDDFETFKNFTAKKRNNEGFEYGATDIRLRELEIYPDLELPAYAEVNEALPFLDIVDLRGTKFMHLPNPTGAKFVDPDFYIRATDTHRDYIYKTLAEETPMLYMSDDMGFEAVEYGPEPGQKTMDKPSVTLSQETSEFISANLDSVNFGSGEATLPAYDGPLGTVSDYSSKIVDTAITEPGVLEKVFGHTAIGQYYGPNNKYYRLDITNKNEVAKHSGFAINAHIPAEVNFKIGDGVKVTETDIFTPPSDNEIVLWMDDSLVMADNAKVNKTQIETWKKTILAKPTKAQIASYMYALVKYYFPNHPSDVDKISKGLPCSTYMYGPYSISAPEITQEKILNAFKAMIDLESYGWTQFTEKNGTTLPLSNTTGGNFAVGMGQINIPYSGIVTTLAQARRAAWDWRYNLELAMKSFALNYNKCVKGKGGEAKNPLDYAIISHNSPAWANTDKFPLPKDSKYYNWVMARFTSKYGADRAYFEATPEKMFDGQLMTKDTAENYLRSLIKEVLNDPPKSVFTFSEPSEAVKNYESKMNSPLYRNVKVLTLDIDPFVRSKLDLKNREFAIGGTKQDKIKAAQHKTPQVVNKINIAVFDSSNQFDKAAADKSLYAFVKGPGSALQSSLAQHFNFRFDTVQEAFDYTSKIVVIKNTAYEAYKRAGKFEDIKWNEIYSLEDIDSYKAVEVAATLREEEFSSVLANNPSQVPEAYRSAFRDILDYDQRGRLLRAFPTFQLFIIDEGRWMAWHKMYDNFYGYSSIVSIDVIKDRRMAADTAVIQMTNVYNNLTTQDSDISYGDWEWKISDLIFGDSKDKDTVWNTIWGLPTEEMEAARKEQLDSLVLKPGARISLRMGYGANAFQLPVVFNGTITEMNTEEIITVVAQGDGIELTNKLNVNPDETTDPGLFSGIKEPRQMICELLTSKGGYFKNLINELSKGVFFNTHPLGIVHFGNQVLPDALKRIFPDVLGMSDDSYGEAGVNVYSGAGYNTFSQWMYTHGEKKGQSLGMDWGATPLPKMKGDEPNILIYLFDKTPWDIFQIYASVCPDYIATVVPFEYRSTLFFGKPWWGLVDKYEYQYKWDDATNSIIREPIGAFRKTFSQFKLYDSDTDIIRNNITATDEYMYTNVIGVYNEADGVKKTMPVQADSDIFPEKQTTAIVHIPLKASAWGTNYWTQDKYALQAATSALKDYMKEMYQGELIVLGDPTAKPYDIMYLMDTCNGMDGNTEMKRVVHHLSFETGFITNISPDCVTVVDDFQGISLYNWGVSAVAGFFAYKLGRKLAISTWRSFLNGPIADSLRKYGESGVDFVIKRLLVDSLPNYLPSNAARTAAIIEGDALIEAIRNIGLKPTDFNLDDAKSIKRLFGMSSNPLFSVPVKVGDEVYLALGKVLKPFKEIYMDPASTSKIIDDIWKSSGWLDKKHLFGNVTHKITIIDSATKKTRVVHGVLEDVKKTLKATETIQDATEASAGIARRFGNFAFRTTSGTVKFVGKPLTKVTAKGLRQMVTMVKKVGWSNIFTIIADVALTIVSAGLIERYGRYLQSRQAVTILPLKYRGKSFLAGVNGHKGMVYGDTPSKIDAFFAGAGFLGGALTVGYAILGIEAPTYQAPGADEIVNQRENDR